MVRDWAAKHGFTLFPEKGFESITLTCVNNGAKPGGRAVDVPKLQKLVKDQGFLIDGGYGKIKGKTFRISNMGDETEASMTPLIAALDNAMKQFKTGFMNSAKPVGRIVFPILALVLILWKSHAGFGCRHNCSRPANQSRSLCERNARPARRAHGSGGARRVSACSSTGAFIPFPPARTTASRFRASANGS